VVWYKRAAEAGNVESMLNLAICYGTGIGVLEDAKQYQMWLQRAAEAGISIRCGSSSISIRCG
jgi:TPR repeat protein